MCKAIEDMIKEGKLEGKLEGELDAKKEIALNMLHAGMKADLIAQLTGLSSEDVLCLQNKDDA